VNLFRRGILLLPLGCIASAAHAAPQYQFTRIVEETESLYNLSHSPSVDASGRVVFTAVSDDLPGIYRGSGGSIETIYASTSPYLEPVWTPATSADGAIAFVAYSSGNKLYRYQDGTIETAATSLTGTPAYGLSINNHGTIAYPGIYTSDDPSNRVLSAKALGMNFLSDSPVINDLGQIAVAGGQVYNPKFGDTILRREVDGTVTTVADSSGDFRHFSLIVDMNNDGTVVFGASNDYTSLSDLYLGIYTWTNGNLHLVADSDAYSFGVLRDYDQPYYKINNSGEVVFATVRSGDSNMGLYTGPDPLVDRIIGPGDALDGSTVVGVDFFRGLNDAGQIAFWAGLEDGRRGIYRADPVPEPSTLILAGIGALALVVQCRTRGLRQSFVAQHSP
jgi:hypothetical protein